MPYNGRLQYRRQRASVGLSVVAAVLQQQYPLRPLIHTRWNNHDTYNPASVPLTGALPPWILTNAGVVGIQTAGVLPELLASIRYYGAFVEGIIPHQPPIIRGSAGAAVIYDRTTDKLYYAVSRYLPGLLIHGTLAARVQQLPAVHGQAGIQINTLVPNRHAETCAEFQALNRALLDGAHEQHLDLWCFRAATMEPLPQCPNCRVTVPQTGLARVWTG